MLLIEADPTGGSAMLAGFFRGTAAQTTGLIDLAWAYREGLLTEALSELPIPVPDSSASLLPGVRAHTQAGSLAALWDPLATALKGLDRTGRDVIIDAGRLGLHISSRSPPPRSRLRKTSYGPRDRSAIRPAYGHPPYDQAARELRARNVSRHRPEGVRRFGSTRRNGLIIVLIK